MGKRWVSLLGFAIAAFLIWWLFRNEDPAEIWSHMRNADFALLLLAVAVTTATFPVRAARWRYFLAPAQPDTPFRSRFAAVCIGFMANNLLPARVGEVARAYSYSRLEPVSVATAIATLVVERFLDGVAILLLLVVALLGPDFPSGTLPEGLVAGIQGISLVLSAVLAASLILLVFPQRSLGLAGQLARALLPSRLAHLVVDFAENIVTGLASLRGWRLMLPAFAWSLGLWALQSLSFWIGFLAFGIELPYTAALLTNAAIAFAVAIPSAPGFVGTFHAGASLALTNVYGIAAAPAKSFAVGWHFGSFLPITFMGLWYARRIGLSLKHLSSEGRAPQRVYDSAGDGSPPRVDDSAGDGGPQRTDDSAGSGGPR